MFEQIIPNIPYNSRSKIKAAPPNTNQTTDIIVDQELLMLKTPYMF